MSLPEESAGQPQIQRLRIPPWLRTELPKGGSFGSTRSLVDDLGLHTVCKSAKCPNMCECFSSGTATFLILGNTCTRNCAFCNIDAGTCLPPEPDEPARVAAAAKKLNLRHAVVTSVTRDDLPDGGAGHFAATITALREALPEATLEVLIPDFQGNETALNKVIAANPDIINHNMETPPGHYSRIRPQANYEQSLTLLKRVKAAGGISKSGFMVGLGEDDSEVEEILVDLASVACDIVTIGQYMQPSLKHPLVRRYVHPDIFELYAKVGRNFGIPFVFSAPLVRSSYNAEHAYSALKQLRTES